MLRALVIAVSRYEQLPSLLDVEQDAYRLEAVLQGNGTSAPQLADIRMLLSPTAQLAEESIIAVLAESTAADEVLIYFAGHSIADSKSVNLLFIDAASEFRSGAGSIAAARLSELIEKTSARSVIVVLDTSNAGLFNLPDSPRIKDSSTSYFFIGSAGPTELAMSPSRFAPAFAQAMSGYQGWEDPQTSRKFFENILSMTDAGPRGQSPVYSARLGSDRRATEATRSRVRGTNSVFISYAHADRKWVDKLRPHLDSLMHDVADVVYWDDSLIAPGSTWQDEIRLQLARANAAILLISANFLASDFIRNQELPHLIALASQRRARLFCVIIRPCRFDKVPILNEFQAINNPLKTLSEMKPADQERIFLKLTDQIEQAFQ